MLQQGTRAGGRPSGAPREVRAVERGTHAVLRYSSAAELRTAVVRYFAAGLEHGERCIYVLNDRSLIEVVDGLDAGGIDVPQHAADGSLQIVRASHVYTPTGAFDLRAALARFHACARRAIDDGYVGLRAAAEMGWAITSRTPVSALAEYEREVDRTMFQGGRFTGLCMYDAQAFGPADLAEIERAHPSALRQEVAPA
jgi:hypothetical protein